MKSFRPTPEAVALFHQATLVLSQVEANGIRVDLKYLDDKIASTSAQIQELTDELKESKIFRTWRRQYGSTTKLGARPQLAEIIFDVLGNPRNPLAKKKKQDKNELDDGSDPADMHAFAHLMEDVPFLRDYFRIEKLKKALTTYLKGIRRETVDGYLHPFFNLHRAISYRSSSSMPNFQNFPIRNPEIAELIRSAFISRDGFQLGEIDFKSAEVCASACYNKDPVLMEYITDPSSNMHRDTAAELFMLRKDQIGDKTTRDCAKNQFVFPQFYGSVYFQCAPAIWESMINRQYKVEGSNQLVMDHLRKKGISKLGNCDPQAKTQPGTFVHHVKKVEQSFWTERFHAYTEWKRRWYSQYQQTGGFKMLTGLVCWGVFRRNEVLNFPIQGSAFHWLLWCLVQIHNWLRRNKMRTRIVGQIHDSIVADIHRKERDDFLAKCKEVITVDLPNHWRWINVPISAEIEIAQPGESWHKKKKVA